MQESPVLQGFVDCDRAAGTHGDGNNHYLVVKDSG
jgi:hypothetical protein